MTACNDWGRAHTLLSSIEQLLVTIQSTCENHALGKSSQFSEAWLTFGKRFAEVIYQNSAVPDSNLRTLLKQVRHTFGLPTSKPYSLNSIRENSAALLKTDWSKQSYANHWLSSDAAQPDSPPRPKKAEIVAILPFQALDTFAEFCGRSKPYWPALAFPTRPTPLAQISTSAPGLIKQPKLFSMVVRGLRGIWMPENPGFYIFPDPTKKNGPDRYWVPFDLAPNPRVALTSLEITDHQWTAAASGAPDLSLERYRNLHTLLNRTAKSNPKPDYVILPELAIPRRWVHSMVKKLLDRGISLIAGVEYREDPQNSSLVHNEALIALRSNYPGYLTNFVVFQPKQAPAWKELADLDAKHGKQFAAPSNGSPDRPVYVHDGFCFGVLICSELSDIENRLRFQGKVDALFVPEWNPDVDTFSALVESAAHDVHAFIAQANNRRYGDTRLRGPMKERFERDLIRVKGGKNDYFVVTEINYFSLRRFQSHSEPPTKGTQLFKPFPIGFPKRLSLERQFFPFGL